MRVESLARQIGGKIQGSSNLEINGIASFQDASADQAVVVLAEKYLNSALATKAGAVILGADLKPTASSKVIISVANPRLAMAKALSCFPDQYAPTSGVHASAVVAESAIIANNVSIGAGCIIGADVQIGRNTVLHPGVIVYPGVRIGENVAVHSGAVLGGDGFGFVRDAGQIIKVPQRGSLWIEDDVEIGANTTIDKGTVSPTIIGKGTKIDNLVQIAHNCKIGQNCLIAAAGAIGGSSVLEDNVTLAGFVAVGDHVHIGENVVVGGRSGVIKDVPANTVVSGFPAQDHRVELRFWAKLRRLVRS